MSSGQSTVLPDVIEFTRSRNYQFKKQLGSGACGETVLLYDELLDDYFVCKKYRPFTESKRKELFDGFVREIKILHKLLHPNIVRIFNYYVYPIHQAGYILMEHVDGSTIDKYVKSNPESITSVFIQVIAGFEYLHRSRVLHRDIRPSNIMVSSDGVVKIIDLGFGKEIFRAEDLEKSVSLNWWCEIPEEFSKAIYDFSTEVYFVGKLFEELIRDNNIQEFQHISILGKMCDKNPSNRYSDFSQVLDKVHENPVSELHFSFNEIDIYREMVGQLTYHLAEMDGGARYISDPVKLQAQLRSSYHKFMLEETIPDCGEVLQCFVEGAFRYRSSGFDVNTVKRFLELLSRCSGEKANVLMLNIHSRLNTVKRVSKATIDDDVPF